MMKYTWNEIIQDSKNLAEKIGKGKYKFILCVGKGGLIPSYFLSKELGIGCIKIINLSSFRSRGSLRGPIVNTKVEGFEEEIKNPNDWLILDDISHTGHTIEYLRERFPRVKIAVILQKKNGGVKADYFGKEIENQDIELPYNI